MPSIINITPDNISRYGMFCMKNIKNPGFPAKQKWFNEQYKSGLRFKMALNENEETAAFIEYIPSEYAWRPIKASSYIFIHCMMTYPKKNQGKGYATSLLNICEFEAKEQGKSGLVVITSEGTWLAGKELFLNSDFSEIEVRGRYNLLVKKLKPEAPNPEFVDWMKETEKYKGWNLIFANQCPYHKKATEDLVQTAKESGIELKVTELKNHIEAQHAPSGFGVFSLIYNGKILEDHYISATRFKNILKKELKSV